MADHVYAKSSFHYIDRFYQKNNKSLTFSHPVNEINENDFIFWTCWLQGLETAPPLVKACINSAVNTANGHRIVVITYDNLNAYISLPGYIIEKHKNNHIQTPQLTDILRLYLLYTYGGVWFDSTVFFSQNIPENLLSEPLFFFQSPLNNTFSPVSSWFIISQKNEIVIYKLLCILLEYWRIKNTYIDYFMFHYFLQAIINNDSECLNIFNKIPYYNNQNPHFLQLKLLFSEFDNEIWDKIINVSFCHKLTYKVPASDNTQKRFSFYSHICEIYKS